MFCHSRISNDPAQKGPFGILSVAHLYWWGSSPNQDTIYTDNILCLPLCEQSQFDTDPPQSFYPSFLRNMGAPSRGDYPSPESESEPYKHAHQADLVMNASLPKKLNGVARPKVAMRRTQEPPRNAEGQIYCDHPECRDNVPIFRRPCEWK